MDKERIKDMKRNLKQRVLDVLTNTQASANKGSGSSADTKNSSASGGKSDIDIPENLTSDCFQLCKIVRHGFPHRPTAMAYDPVQRLVAVGNKAGSIRLLGQPGVDLHVTHDFETPVIQLLFLINEGGLISVCADNSINMWNLRQKKPGISHTLKFNREKITYCHLPYQSKWLYVGTDRGNVHLCRIETFVLSGYVINWNKAIELSQKSHPGYIVGICENPCDENRLLIAFETGLVVVWDLKSKFAECRYYADSGIRSIAWHHEGKQFMSCHTNGSLSVWNMRNAKAQQVQFPHAKSNESSKFDNYWSVDKLEWKSCRNGEAFVIFTGGLSKEMDNVRPSVTVMRGKSMTVLEMDYNVVDFITLSKTPWQCDFQDPVALAVLLDKELVVVDLLTTGYPSIEFPHPMDIHDSPVTCLHYVLDTNSDIIPGLYQVSSTKPKRSSASRQEWPLNGGEWSIDNCTGVPELMITGHADGTVRFWDASAVSLRELYKLRTYKFFKRSKKRSESTVSNAAADSDDRDLFAISHIYLSTESRSLVVSNASGVVMFCELNRSEISKEVTSIELAPISEPSHVEESTTEQSQGSINDLKPLLRQGSESLFAASDEHKRLSKSYSDDVRVNNQFSVPPHAPVAPPLLKIRPGPMKQSGGFQAELICLLPGCDVDSASPITEICCSSLHGVAAIGTMTGLHLIDVVQKKVILAMPTCDLSPDRRKQPRSPNRIKPPTSLGDLTQAYVASDQNPIKSPSVDTNESPQSGSRTPHKEHPSNVSNSGGSAVPPPRPKRPPNRSNNKKSSSSFDRSIDSQASVVTEDSAFSRASSVCDLDRQDPRDMVTSLIFMESYGRKDDSALSSTLWLGTAGGSIHVIEISRCDQRNDSAVIAIPTGTVIHMKGSVVNCSFLNSLGQPLLPASLNWKDSRRLEQQTSVEAGAALKVSPDVNKHHQSSSSLNVDKQFIIVTSEKQVKVFGLPAQSLMHVHNVQTDTGFILRTELAVVQSSTCLLCHSSNGRISVLSLPSLSPLMDVDYLPPNDVRIAQTLCFTSDAQVIYMPTPSEVQRVTCSVEVYERIQEIVGHLFIAIETPERPNPGFFKSLFGGGVSELDREELFGEATSGKASRSVAKHIPGSGSTSLEGLRGAAQHELSEMQRLKLAALERGEKLGELEDKTRRMQDSAQKFSENAHSLMMKYKNKKWYQL